MWLADMNPFRFWGTAVDHQKRVRSDRSSRPIEDVLRGDELVCGLVDQAVLMHCCSLSAKILAMMTSQAWPPCQAAPLLIA